MVRLCVTVCSSSPSSPGAAIASLPSILSLSLIACAGCALFMLLAISSRPFRHFSVTSCPFPLPRRSFLMLNMKLRLAFLRLLLFLPFGDSSSGLFFNTHSSCPWSHNERWGPLSQRLFGVVSKANDFETEAGPADVASPNPGMSIPNFTETDSMYNSLNSGVNTVMQQEDSKPRSLPKHCSHDSDFEGPGSNAQIGGYGFSNTGHTGNEDGLDLYIYVRFKGNQVARVVGLIAWLLLLFYLLGTTASDYFSCTLEKLSEVLDLSPAVAGVTLLAIGNGAPDVFSSVLSFATSDRSGNIGFGSVLGGALFITTVVSGTVSLVTCRISKGSEWRVGQGSESMSQNQVKKVDSSNCKGMQNGSCEGWPTVGTNGAGKKISSAETHANGASEQNNCPGVCIEDGVCCFCNGQNSTLVCRQPAAHMIDGVCFVRDVIFLLVAVGILTVILVDGEVHMWEAVSFLCVYPLYAAFVWIAELFQNRRRKRRSVLLEPLLCKDIIESSILHFEGFRDVQQHTHFHHQHHVHSQEVEAELEEVWEDPKDHSLWASLKHWLLWFYRNCIELPLSIPRRLTIPVVEEERWSRKLAITSCTLAPMFVAIVWASHYANSSTAIAVSLVISAGFGFIIGMLAYFYTDEAHPPRRCLTLWLAGGFVMSIVWFYLVANELVTSLEILGNIFGISTAVLGLTLLAWGNSVGDFVADLALAYSGPDGVQMAMSGCYAGPLFNVVVGLGLSLFLGCCYSSPEPYLIVDRDGSLFYIVGFLALGLIWALVILPVRGWRLGQCLGIGLIVLYCSFFVVVVCYAVGWIT